MWCEACSVFTLCTLILQWKSSNVYYAVNGNDEKDVPWVAGQSQPGSYSVSQGVLDKS